MVEEGENQMKHAKWNTNQIQNLKVKLKLYVKRTIPCSNNFYEKKQKFLQLNDSQKTFA